MRAALQYLRPSSPGYTRWSTLSRWIATEGGLTRYRPQDQPPRIVLKEVIADRHYDVVDSLNIPVSQDFLLFHFQGMSWTTGPERLAYAYRLVGREDEWSYTYERHVEYRGLNLGDYTFEVRAIDRESQLMQPWRWRRVGSRSRC